MSSAENTAEIVSSKICETDGEYFTDKEALEFLATFEKDD
jgi:hypothetical protein